MKLFYKENITMSVTTRLNDLYLIFNLSTVLEQENSKTKNNPKKH